MNDLIGKQVVIRHHSIGQDGKYICREVEHGVVLACYPHIFSVKIGNHIECFRYHELTGNESTQVRLK